MGATTVSAVSNMAANMRIALDASGFTALGESISSGLASGIHVGFRR